jgi:hypothetical protein
MPWWRKQYVNLNVRRYLQDCTTSRPRRLSILFIVCTVRTTNLTCTRMFYGLSSVNQKKRMSLISRVIRRERGTSGDQFFIRPALSQLKSMPWYIIKAPISQETMSLSLNLKFKKSLWRGFTLFKSHFRRNLVRDSNVHWSYYFYVTFASGNVSYIGNFSFSFLYPGCFHRTNP